MDLAAPLSANLVHYSQCPVCSSAKLNKLWPVRDYTVTAEEFLLVECAQCSLRFTQDVPDREHITRYYQSDTYISHSNTRKGLISRLYHLVRKRTLVGKRSFVEKATGLHTGRLLDVGAGVGAFAGEMKRHGWQVTGLEPDAGAREVARKEFNIVLLDISALKELPSASFDAITLWHVLEHVHPLQEYMAEFRRLLSVNGVLILAVPNYTSADAAYYGPFWAAYDVPRHLYHFSPASMQVLLAKHGLQCVQMKSMPFDSYYVSLLSNRYKTGKHQWLRALWQGWKSNRKAGKDKGSSMIYVGK